jgi:biopolymer transport protein TolR
MGADLKKRGGGRKGKYAPMAQINVTPFVDVMLVLLIIFMVTAPLLATGVKVDIPQSSAKPLSKEEKPLSVSLRADGKVFLMDEEVAANTLVERLRAIADSSKETRIFVRADEKLSYGQVMKVMGMINCAGFNKVALVTQPMKGGK